MYCTFSNCSACHGSQAPLTAPKLVCITGVEQFLVTAWTGHIRSHSYQCHNCWYSPIPWVLHRFPSFFLQNRYIIAYMSQIKYVIILNVKYIYENALISQKSHVTPYPFSFLHQFFTISFHLFCRIDIQYLYDPHKIFKTLNISWKCITITEILCHPLSSIFFISS